MPEKKPVEVRTDGRWVAECLVDPNYVSHLGFNARRDLFKMVIDELVESVFNETGSPVDLKISVREVHAGDYDPNTFQENRPGWHCRIEAEKRLPGRKAIDLGAI